MRGRGTMVKSDKAWIWMGNPKEQCRKCEWKEDGLKGLWSSILRMVFDKLMNNDDMHGFLNGHCLVGCCFCFCFHQSYMYSIYTSKVNCSRWFSTMVSCVLYLPNKHARHTRLPHESAISEVKSGANAPQPNRLLFTLNIYRLMRLIWRLLKSSTPSFNSPIPPFPLTPFFRRSRTLSDRTTCSTTYSQHQNRLYPIHGTSESILTR